uniref:Uncharacterized protein n=1 Tax=Hyaloperonospora arabidopsidis (strain Emoy2) TaxID=559515 RepID=M4BMD4_HYAAE
MNSSLKPLVLELGARYVRCGVSGERAPRCVERWEVSAVTLVPSMLAVLYATANHTALVVDCGWAETRMLPVFKGIPLLHLYTSEAESSVRIHGGGA